MRMYFKQPLSVCYLETNTNNVENLGRYFLENIPTKGSYLFDIGILFAANINGTPDEPELFLNDGLQEVLDSGIVAALQSMGMKITISILGNHQTAGISSLTSNGVVSFANQLVALVKEYNLDGLDFDDEYSDGIKNETSFPSLIRNLRQQLPDKLLTLYYIGGPTDTADSVGDLLDFAWNPYYGQYNPISIQGMSKEQIGAAAINCETTPESQADDFAKRTLNDGYGVYLYYNLFNQDLSTYLSSISEILYGKPTFYK